MKFDITPYLFPDDPWMETDDGLRNAVAIYQGKFDVARYVMPKSILEIGVRAGYSAMAFLMACPQATYVGLDANVEKWGGWPGAPNKAKRMLQSNFPGRYSILCPSDTKYLAELPPTPTSNEGGVWDLVHVDGDHSEKGAYRDLRLCLKRCRNILVDDIDWHPDTVGRAVKQFLEETGLPAIKLETVRGDMLIRGNHYLE